MDLRRHLLTLVLPLRVGDEILPGARLLDSSEELGMRLTFAVGPIDVHVEVAAESEPLPFAARTRLLKFSYRAGSGEAAVPPAVGVALCKAVAAASQRNEQRFLEDIDRDAAAARLTNEGATRIREVRVERLLERAGAGRNSFYTLSPYVGCLIGCRFCYAQTRLAGARRLSRLPEVPWGSYVDARVNAPDVLARELESLPVRPIKFCPIVSDPYQAVERRYEISRACLDVIAAAASPWPTMVLTRSRLIERDAERIASLPRGYAGCSIPTADDEVRRHFEPRGASIPDRLAALRALSSAGARSFAVVQPILPGPIEALADALAGAVSSVRIDVLHGVEGAAAEFADPRYAHCVSDSWQIDRARELSAALAARGVSVWADELPEELCG